MYQRPMPPELTPGCPRVLHCLPQRDETLCSSGEIASTTKTSRKLLAGACRYGLLSTGL